MYHRIYLDTHFIDYLYDHRDDIWEGSDDALDAAEQAGVGDAQLDDYAWLRMLPLFAWLNNWWLRVGEEVLKQLGEIKDSQRCAELTDYALQIAEQSQVEPQFDDDGIDAVVEEPPPPRDPRQYAMFRELGFEDDYPRPEDALHLLDLPKPRKATPRNYPRSPEESLARLPKTDRALVEEAIALHCDVFLTVDRRVLKQAAQVEDWFDLRIRTLTDFIYEEAEAHDFSMSLESPSPDLAGWNELELYTKLIPAG